MTIYVSTLTFCRGIEVTNDQSYGPYYYGCLPIAWLKFWLNMGGTYERQRIDRTVTIDERE
jgi:hypothetical protein